MQMISNFSKSIPIILNFQFIVILTASLVLFAPSAVAAEAGTGADNGQVDSPVTADDVIRNGVSRSGRIPKPEFPADIQYPERWRYIPEAHLKPGNIIDRYLTSTFIVPVIFYEQDIGAGAGLSIFDIDFRQQRRKEVAGMGFSYSTEGQQTYGIGWRRYLNHRELAQGGVILEERSHVQAAAAYVKTLTRRFFGIGPDSLESDESSYTNEMVVLYTGLQNTYPTPGSDFIYSVNTRWEHRNLAPGRVSGKPTTDMAYAADFEDGDDYQIVWTGASLAYDTRDSQHNPYKGWMVKMDADWAPVQTGDGMAAIYEGTTNWVIKVPGLFHSGGDGKEEHPPTDVISLGGQLEWVEGDLPFWALPTLGGRQTLRGYIANRFTDRALWHTGAEYRFWTFPRGFRISESMRIERLGLALFYEMGNVADDLGALWEEKVKYSYGVGFRLTLERQALFRADVGFSKEGANVSFGFGNSF